MEILDLGKHLFNIITKSEKLCDTRIIIEKYTSYRSKTQKTLWEVNEMLLLALKKHSKLDFEFKYYK